MKKVDMTTRAFREHVANCLICTKIKDTTDFRGAELCDVGCALAAELCDRITKDEQYMRLLRICEREEGRGRVLRWVLSAPYKFEID